MLTGIRPSYMANPGLRTQQNPPVQKHQHKKEVSFSGTDALSSIDPATRNLAIGMIAIGLVAPLLPYIYHCLRPSPLRRENI